MIFLNFLLVIFVLPLVLSESSLNGVVEINTTSGEIRSPGYPTGFRDNISCTWLFNYSKNSTLILRVIDIDIQEDKDCNDPPCCEYNWLALGLQKYCGRNNFNRNLTVVYTNGQTEVNFHSSKVFNLGRGFRLMYYVCSENQFRCADSRSCVDNSLLCDGISHCGDGSDEWKCGACDGDNMVPCGGIDTGCYNNLTQRCDGNRDCPITNNDEKNCFACDRNKLYCKNGGCYPMRGWCDDPSQCASGWEDTSLVVCGACPPQQVSCAPQHSCHCFKPRTQRCDGQMDCPRGEDELSCHPECEDKLACLSTYPGSATQICYSPEQKCDGIVDCPDHSDEIGCFRPEESKYCGGERHTMDDTYSGGEPGCSENSEDTNCIKNSIITAVVMGSLACGMIAVLGAAMGWRYYYTRCHLPGVISVGGGGGGGYRRQGEEPLDEASLYHLYREPPPSYHEAMTQDGNTPLYCHPTRFMNMSSRRTDTNAPAALPRRERCIGSRPPQPLPKPPQLIKPIEENTQTSSHIIRGDQMYPESSISSEQGTPMLDLFDGNTSGVCITRDDSDSISPSGTSMSSLISCESQSSYQYPS